MAIRDNRIAAESVGISVTKYKMMAFVTSAVLAGAAGALYGLNYSTIAAHEVRLQYLDPDSGVRGAGRHWATSAARSSPPTLLTVLPELLREFCDYRMLIYAIVLILVMLATNNPSAARHGVAVIPAPEDMGRGTRKEALRRHEEDKKCAATRWSRCPATPSFPSAM